MDFKKWSQSRKKCTTIKRLTVSRNGEQCVKMRYHVLMYYYCVLLLGLFWCCEGQLLLQPSRFRRLTALSPQKLKNRLAEKLLQYRVRNTKIICYETVGCFELPRSRSPLQKEPEAPEMIGTKFYLYRRNVNFSEPEVLHYGDGGESVRKSKFNASQPLKLIIHGYMSKWNEKGALMGANAYLKISDCNVILMDWTKGARGPQYATAAANTELVGRQLAILLLHMITAGLNPKNIHLIGFSLGAHVAGSASEIVKMKGHLIGRITGLDAASPLFRNNNLREKYKKLDREDAHFVDVIHTDASPLFTDGFGLWEPIGHVDFFPNGGQEQPGCVDTRGAIVVSHFEKTLTRDIACSHIRAWQLFLETLRAKMMGEDNCEFIAYSCAGGLPSFEKGHCFPQIDANLAKNSSAFISQRRDLGRLGEDVMGEGVLYFVTRAESPFCGTQMQASVYISQKTRPNRGVLQLHLEYSNHTVNFQIKCEVLDFIMTGTEMNGLAVAEYNTLNSSVEKIDGSLSYINLEYEEGRNRTHPPILYIDRIIVKDMFGNSWQYCKKDTILEDKTGLHYDVIPITLTKHC